MTDERVARERLIIIAVDINWIYYRNSIRGGIQRCIYLSRLNCYSKKSYQSFVLLDYGWAVIIQLPFNYPCVYDVVELDRIGGQELYK